jgi:hypothetical protein
MSNLATIVNNILADSGIDDINVVVSTGSYADPVWITSLAWTKITGAPANIVTGTGTTNYLPKFTSNGSTIGNSIVFDNGTNVGIGTNNPSTSSALTITPALNQFNIDLVNTGTGGLIWQIASTNNDFNAGGGRLIFTYGNNSANSVLTLVQATAEVLIGTNTSNGNKLRVNGNIFSDGVIASVGNINVGSQLTFTPAESRIISGTGSFAINDNANSRNQLLISNSTGAATFFSTVTATSFIRSGGTSSQFLKADGSVDSNAYITGNQTITLSGDATGSGTTAITVVLANSGVAAGTYNNSATQVRPFTVDAKGRITSIGTAVTITPAFSDVTGKPTTLSGYGITDAYTQTQVNTLLSGYLPLTGGTLTGQLIGTNARFVTPTLNSSFPAIFLNEGTGSGTYGQISATDFYHGIILRGIPTNNTDFSVTGGDQMSFYEFGGDFRFYKKNGSTLQLQASIIEGAGNFISSLTATSFIRSGGTSSQYLMADGSVSTLTNPVTGTGTTNFLPKFTGASTIGNSIITDNGSSIEITSSELNNLFVTNTTTTGATTGSGIGFKAFNGTSVAQAAGIILTSNTWSFGTYSPNQLSIGSDGSGGLALRSANAAPIRFFTGGTTAGLSTLQMTLNSSGNLGLGVTPSAWGASWSAQQFGQAGSLFAFKSGSNFTVLSNNSYVVGGDYQSGDARYINDGLSTAYIQNNSGQHLWMTAPSGTAGNAISFTQAMTLGSNSGLSIGTPSAAPAQGLLVQGQGRFNAGVITSGNIEVDNTNNGLVLSKIFVGPKNAIVSDVNGDLLFNSSASGFNNLRFTGAATFSSSVTAVGLSSTTSATGNLNTRIRNNVTSASGSTGYGLAIESEASAATSYALTVRNLAESNTYFHISTETSRVGFVGIGTASPSAKLYVDDDGSVISNVVAAFGNSSISRWDIRNAGNPTSRRILSGYVGSSENIRFDPISGGTSYFNSGNLLIGTTTDAGYKLDVNGTGRFSGGGSNGYLYVSGNAGAGGPTNPAYLQGMNFSWNKSNGGGESLLTYTNQGGGSNIRFGIGYWNNSTYSEQFSIASTGAATFSSSVNTGGNVNVGGQLTFTPAESRLISGSSSFAVNNNANDANQFRIENSTGAATFRSGIATSGYTASSSYAAIFNGAVGIGTSTPSTTDNLTLSSSTSFNLQLTNPGTGGVTWQIGATSNVYASGGNRLVFTYGNASANSVLTLVQSTGNVLIGTTTDSGFKLFVNGNAKIANQAQANDFFSSNDGLNVGGYNLYSQTISGAMGILGHNVRASSSVANQVNVVNGGWISSMIKQYYNDGITFHTDTTVYSAGAIYPMAATERMRITSGGNVGIGTNSPGTYDAALIGTSHRFLNVQSTSNTYAVATLAGNQSSADSRIGYLTFVNNNNSSSYKYSAWIGSEVEGATANQLGGRLIFSTTGNASSAGPIERARITSGGNLLVGTTTDAGYKLDVQGTGRFSPASSSSSSPTLMLNQASLYANIAGAGDMYHGLIMRGVPAAAGDYSVTAGDQMSFYEYGGIFNFYKKQPGVLVRQAYIDNGNIYATGDVIAFASSDRRLKDNLTKIESSLEKVGKLSGYSFDWNSNQETYSGKDYGVVAQEVEAIFPELVKTRDNGYKAVKYEKLIPVLIEAIKELNEKVEKLK